MDQQPRKITVLVEPGQFDRFEAYCESRGCKKSTLICRLIRQHLDAQQFHLQGELSFEREQLSRRTT